MHHCTGQPLLTPCLLQAVLTRDAPSARQHCLHAYAAIGAYAGAEQVGVNCLALPAKPHGLCSRVHWKLLQHCSTAVLLEIFCGSEQQPLSVCTCLPHCSCLSCGMTDGMALQTWG